MATAAEAEPEVAGKPHRPTADAIAARVPDGDLRAMVGDRPATDGALAAQLGVPFALVLSGVTPPDGIPADAGAAATAADCLTLVREAPRLAPVAAARGEPTPETKCLLRS